MIKNIALLILILLFTVCANNSNPKSSLVQNTDELETSITNAKAGDEIVLANGVWKDVQIYFIGKGTKENPIILKAETPGKVTLEGQSFIKISGEHLIVDGLYFKNGYTPSNTVIEFRTSKRNIANNCIVRNCVIEDYVQPNRYNPDHWVTFWGRNNQLDHCYIAGKFNQGPTVRVNLSGNQHIYNYHQITNNHFGPRPRKGGPKAETIQIGDSYTSMTPSYLNVSNNFFERCNGEVEVISSKTNFNKFNNNVFFECEGSLVFRHGNYCMADGNFFIGNKDSQFNGGIRVINTGHWVTNNYFYMLKGDEFRSALAVMNGIPKSPLNRYNQVTDVVVAHNTWVDCASPWQFSVGANMNKKDVLPAREIRSARPLRTLLANNIIYNSEADETPIKAYDKVTGVSFKNNVIDNQNSAFTEYDGIATKSIKMQKINDWLFAPAEYQTLNSAYAGFGFEDIKKDIFGNSRKDENSIGAINKNNQTKTFDIDRSKYGPGWYSSEKPKNTPRTISVSAGKEALLNAVSQAKNGDVLELIDGEYNLDQPLKISKRIIIRSKNENKKSQINFSGSKNSPAFEMNPKGNLILKDILLIGNNDQFAFASLEKNMSFGYNLNVMSSQISGFKNILKAYRGSFADTILFSHTDFRNCLGGIELAAETDDKGDYNAEFVFIENCTFENIQTDVINFYRGGYDESTIGGNLTITGSKFKNCGAQEKSKILLKTRGIINVEISNNSFENNPVKLIALLWGEKNNHHSENTKINSGIIRVDHYLKQKLVY
ncbi:MAG: alginate lyase [Calditrichaeota bacterium]|nr:MAG: alginate lyase [Calditrichota bacterium]MBL1204770.1 alginate lyase [Calditrichota bacterium]NOG44598.1 alginate lyase [Calditrichota bacterium]